MRKGKGGAAPTPMGLSENDYQILYDLGFDEGDLEMIMDFTPSIALDDIIYKYMETAHAVYNIDIPSADSEIFSQNVTNALGNSRVTKRDIALETVYNFTRAGVGGKKTKRTRKNKSKKKRTRKSRR